jgi:bacteriocin biosynthesis cyclodehydratase domain-containing protein
MHPMLKPALRCGWRNRQTVQFGVATAHAVVLGPVDTATGSFLALLDGTRGMPLLRAEAEALGMVARRADELVDRLAAAGLLDDPTAPGGAALRAPAAAGAPAAGPGSPAAEPPGGAGRTRAGPAAAARCPAPPAGAGSMAAWDRMRPDLASLSVVHPEPGAAMRRMSGRTAARVQVRGAGRVGTAVAAALSASGVGHVDVMDGGCVEPWDVTPSGLPPKSVGDRRSVAARRVVRAAAPGPLPRCPRHGAGEPGTALVVFAPRDGLAAYAPDPAAAEEVMAAGTPHLYAGVIEGTGVVGPLVLPGSTACAGCLALERAGQEPAWPRMLAQWRSGRGSRGVPACDTALATVVAGLAASYALTCLDGRLPVVTGGRLEFALPDLPWNPRPVPPHPACACGAARQLHGTGAETPSPAGEPHATMTG